jgi:hypothetical protein
MTMYYYVYFHLNGVATQEWLRQTTEEEAAHALREVYVSKTGTFVDGVRITSERLSRVTVVRTEKEWSVWNDELERDNAGRDMLDWSSIQDFIRENAEWITNDFLRKHVVAAQENRDTENGGTDYVFISYSHEDDAAAKSIARALTSIGVPHFLDKKDIRWGDRIKDSVRSALRKCSHQIIILSPATDDSRWVHYECGVADGGSKTLLPFRVHPKQKLPGYMTDVLAKDSVADVRAYFESKKTRTNGLSQ